MFLSYTYGLTAPPGLPLSPSAFLTTLGDNVARLDMLSYRGRRARTEYQRQPIEASMGDPTVLGWGSFQFRTGLTTLNLHVGFPVTSTLQVLLDGVMVVNQSASAGAQVISVALTGRGYTEYQVVDVTVQVGFTGAFGYRLYDAYVFPVSGIVGSPPSLPAAITTSLTHLDGLAQLADWQMRLLAACTQTAFTGQVFLSHYGEITSGWPVWSGSISRSNGANRLILPLEYRIPTSQSEYLQLWGGGSVIATGPTWSAGAAGGLTFDIDLSSWGDGAITDLQLVQVITATGGGAHLGSSYSVLDAYTQRTSYPYATPPPPSSPLESLSIEALASRLNTLRSTLSAITTRLQAAPDVFDRQRLTTWLPGHDAGQRAYYATQRTMAVLGRRAHQTLWVRGQGLTLAWGSRTLEAKDGNPYRPTWEHEQQVTAGDQVETKKLSFDSFPGLFPGVAYAILGDTRYAHEGVE